MTDDERHARVAAALLGVEIGYVPARGRAEAYHLVKAPIGMEFSIEVAPRSFACVEIGDWPRIIRTIESLR